MIESRCIVQFCSVQSLDRLGRRGDMRDDSAEIFFQSFLHEAIVISSGITPKSAHPCPSRKYGGMNKTSKKRKTPEKTERKTGLGAYLASADRTKVLRISRNDRKIHTPGF